MILSEDRKILDRRVRTMRREVSASDCTVHNLLERAWLDFVEVDM